MTYRVKKNDLDAVAFPENRGLGLPPIEFCSMLSIDNFADCGSGSMALEFYLRRLRAAFRHTPFARKIQDPGSSERGI